MVNGTSTYSDNCEDVDAQLIDGFVVFFDKQINDHTDEQWNGQVRQLPEEKAEHSDREESFLPF
jgi:hypothetical protein